MENILLFNEIVYRPIFNLLILFLKIFQGNLGFAIIFLTLLVRGLMFKQSMQGNNMQQGMSNLQPKLQEIQEKYKDDPQRLSQETMKVFKQDGKGPLKGCLMMLIQIPIFIGLFYVIRNFAGEGINADTLYSFFRNFGQEYISVDAVNTNFFGMDLLGNHNIGLTAFASIFTYLQMKLTSIAKPAAAPIPGSKVPDMSKMMGFMGIFMAFIMGSFVYSMQNGVGLYIATTTMFSSLQYGIQYRAILKTKLNAFFAGKGNKGSKPQIIESPKK